MICLYYWNVHVVLGEPSTLVVGPFLLVWELEGQVSRQSDWFEPDHPIIWHNKGGNASDFLNEDV